ncbi:hypothetical protein U6A24_02115 [Aquimarina gracilis]|uniref:ATP-grasp domain-containing protein n=1 Tax=Aquimarina gracilis TaxID=874422 RepID=A0ABU5ZQ91_9FLAO|nr:hypothetical protein [Aquimarina gracilis]MEB3344233.1 hypothetical protein [Aquimarina gracilis]
MILVISEANDITTNEVIEWLNHFNADYVRSNFTSYTKLNYIQLSNDSCHVALLDIEDIAIKKIWNRRGGLRLLPTSLRGKKNLYPYLKKEENSLLKSLEDILNKKVDYVGSYHMEVENYKLDYLLLAKEVGLNIPETLITTSKKEVFQFFEKHKSIITKDIRYPIKVNLTDITIFSSGTFVVNYDMIKSMEEDFAPTLVQKKIEKKYEIRIFFFKERLFPMAILSQNDQKTAVDYRNYNREKPNRNIPVLLPKKIEKKVKDFINLSTLSTGSLDLIVSQSNDYIFLEVNPQGQLDWVSKNCNYYIEKEIAEYLIA